MGRLQEHSIRKILEEKDSSHLYGGIAGAFMDFDDPGFRLRTSIQGILKAGRSKQGRKI